MIFKYALPFTPRFPRFSPPPPTDRYINWKTKVLKKKRSYSDFSLSHQPCKTIKNKFNVNWHVKKVIHFHYRVLWYQILGFSESRTLFSFFFFFFPHEKIISRSRRRWKIRNELRYEISPWKQEQWSCWLI